MIIAAVARYFDLAPEVLIGRRRDEEAALARHIAVYLIREETGSSFSKIGRELGNRHHSAILRSYHKIAAGIADNPQWHRYIIEIIAEARKG